MIFRMKAKMTTMLIPDRQLPLKMPIGAGKDDNTDTRIFDPPLLTGSHFQSRV